jgi:hypothetical protein
VHHTVQDRASYHSNSSPPLATPLLLQSTPRHSYSPALLNSQPTRHSYSPALLAIRSSTRNSVHHSQSNPVRHSSSPLLIQSLLLNSVSSTPTPVNTTGVHSQSRKKKKTHSQYSRHSTQALNSLNVVETGAAQAAPSLKNNPVLNNWPPPPHTAWRGSRNPRSAAHPSCSSPCDTRLPQALRNEVHQRHALLQSQANRLVWPAAGPVARQLG